VVVILVASPGTASFLTAAAQQIRWTGATASELLIKLIRFYHGACQRAVARSTKTLGGSHMIRYLHLVVMFVLITAGTVCAQESAPKFTDYPARVVSTRRSVRVQLRSTPYTQCFRTMLRRVVSHGLRFGGHYTVGSWGCGTCLRLGIVDLITGRSYVTPFEASSRRASITVRPDSKLLIMDDPEHAPGLYYVWNGRQLLPIYDRKVERREPQPEFLRCAEMTAFR